MQDMNEVKTLIDKAAEVCGSRVALARRLGVVQQHISQWSSGDRTCQPEDIAAMAYIAGYDAMEFLARAIVRKAEGSKKGDLLRAGLGKYLPAIGAAIVTSGTNATGLECVARSIRCILC